MRTIFWDKRFKISIRTEGLLKWQTRSCRCAMLLILIKLRPARFMKDLQKYELLSLKSTDFANPRHCVSQICVIWLYICIIYLAKLTLSRGILLERHQHVWRYIYISNVAEWCLCADGSSSIRRTVRLAKVFRHFHCRAYLPLTVLLFYWAKHFLASSSICQTCIISEAYSLFYCKNKFFI